MFIEIKLKKKLTLESDKTYAVFSDGTIKELVDLNYNNKEKQKMDENKTNKGLAECVNRISDAVLGVRECSEDEILEQIEIYKEDARRYKLIKNKSKIVDAIDNLISTIEEIEES